MTRLTQMDRWLFATLLPVAVLILCLHVREAVGPGGLAEPPIFAAPPATRDGYPTVGGVRRERGLDWGGLEPGDVLRKVGDRDLRGVGYFAFDVIALEQAGPSHATVVVFERDGVTHEAPLRMSKHPLSWYRVPGVLAFLIAAVWVLIRSAGSNDARILFATFSVVSIFMLPLLSPTPWLTWIHLLKFNFGGSVAFTLVFLWAITFPPGLAKANRLPLWWASAGTLHGIVRTAYWLPGTPDRTWVPNLTLSFDLIFIAMIAAIIARNYRYLDAVPRRRVKWVLLALVTWTGLMGVAAFSGTVSTDVLGIDFPALVVASGLFGVLLPVALGISVIRYNLFDIDRALSATAAYSLALVVAVVCAIAASSGLGEPISSLTGLSPAVGQSAVLAVVGCIAVPLGMRMQPRLDRWFFPDRAATMQEAGQLLRDLPLCETPEDVFDVLGRRVHAIFRAADAGVFVRAGSQFVSADKHERFAATNAFPSALERNPQPMDIAQCKAKAGTPIDAHSDLHLESLAAAIAIPVRCGQELSGFVLIGSKLSGDIFTIQELSTLSALSSAASAELLRMRGVGLIETARNHALEMTRLREAAEEANRVKSNFLAAVSHDLRQPLHAIVLLLETLDREITIPTSRGTLEKIGGATAALTDMIGSLLDLSRIEARSLRPTIVEVDLDALLLGIADEFDQGAQRKGLRIVVGTSRLTVKSDAMLLGRIIRNLVSNAIRYTEKGDVALSARRMGDNVEIRIADTGPGIPDDKKAVIFDEFVRLHDGGDGLGLGLAIVKGLAGLLQHEVEFDSRVGLGTTFSVYAPFCEAVTLGSVGAEPSLALNRRIGRPFEGRRFVVVDDDLRVLDAMRSILETWGADVIVAASLEDVTVSLERVTDKVDLVIADYKLAADNTGLDAVDRIRELVGYSIPAIAITAETAEETVEAIRRARIPMLTKPVKPARLRAAIEERLST